MPQVNMVEGEFEREMLAIVTAINTIEAALDGIAVLASDMQTDIEREVAGDKIDLFTTNFPSYIRAVRPSLGLTDASIWNAMTSLEVLEDEIRQLDDSFRNDMEEVYTFNIDRVREEYEGERDYLDPDDVAELDEFFKRRSE